ncbi:MAG: hypothetical protein JG780_1908, partial [Thermosipho sp. (in: Bacteria)]|nr:hypothetical protein [Thermosipho sp. (in: thermotogales)]
FYQKGAFGITFSAFEFEKEKLFSISHLFEKKFNVRKLPNL